VGPGGDRWGGTGCLGVSWGGAGGGHEKRPAGDVVWEGAEAWEQPGNGQPGKRADRGGNPKKEKIKKK